MKFRVSKFNDNGILIGLMPIVDCVTPYAMTGDWIIEEIKGYGKLRSGISIEDFQRKLGNGKRLSWEQIVNELAGLDQITDLELSSPDGNIKSIVCFDATFWEIDCDDSIGSILMDKSRKQGFNISIA